MTDHKSWLWRKKSSEKTITVAEKVEVASRQHEEQMHVLLAEKAELERDLKDSGDKLSSALAECNAKDDLVKKHSNTAKEALAGWEKAEAKAMSLKEELDEALKERDISEERARHLDAALKECMQQLRFVREDKEQRIHDVMLKAAEELGETKMFLESKLQESGRMIAKQTSENSQLAKAVLLKDQLIEELNIEKAKVESDVNSLLARLQHIEKDNNSLLYEVRVLEKEVDIRNEEREFNRRTTDASHKQHLENVKKIAKLESECQRLRVLVRKRLPGPAALAKMKSEVDMLGRDSVDNRRKKSNLSYTGNSMQLDYGLDSYPESPDKKMKLLTEKIYALEEENNSLRETLQRKADELQLSRNMYIQSASQLSRFETQLEESHKSQLIRDASLSLATMSDVGSDDKVSCTGSWASKSVGMSDINHLMDDFAEMEKLALVCVDKPVENSSTITSTEISTGKELVPIVASAGTDADVAEVKGDGLLSSKLSKSISKLIEIIHGINSPFEDHDASQTPSRRNDVHGFQWRTPELASTLQHFLQICDDMLIGKAEFETFTEEMTDVLELILKNCFSVQEVKPESETEVGKSGQLSEASKLPLLENGYHSESCCDVIEEGRKLKDVARDIGFAKQELECESLRNQLQISENTIAHLKIDMEALKHSKAMVEDQFENHMMTIEDLNSQLLAVNSTMDEAQEKIAGLQAEIDNKVNHCEELEANCLELRVQLERVRKVDTIEDPNQDKKQLQTEWEISAASEKLAECQESILHLGKQLQALATSRDAAVSDKFMSTPTKSKSNMLAASSTTLTSEKKLTNERSSLLDQMQADDDISETDQLESPKTKEMIYAKDYGSYSTSNYTTTAKNNEISVSSSSLAIVPSKKPHTTSGGLFKKLLKRKTKGISKKMPLPFAA